jgi:hypothetical protein
VDRRTRAAKHQQVTCGAGALTREMVGADLPVRTHLALDPRHYELAALQRSVQIGRHAQQYETSDVDARRYIEVDHQRWQHGAANDAV